MGIRRSSSAVIIGAFLVACAAGTPPPEAAEPSEPAPQAEEDMAKEPETKEPEAESSSDDESADTAKAKDGEAPLEPKFTDSMSVEEAIQAVPQGGARLNMEDDLLSKPLTQSSLYAPCKPGGNLHFKVRVAVWNGKAVGVDVSTRPNSPRFAECIQKQVRGAQWEDKVPSLNTVEYSY